MEAFEFDFDHYINTLINEMGFQNAEQNKQEELKKSLEKQLGLRIMNALMLNLEPEEFNEAMEKLKNDSEPLQEIIQKAVQGSIAANQAVGIALDDFFNEMVDSAQILAV